METSEVIKAIKQNRSSNLTDVLYKVAFPPIKSFIKLKRGTVNDAEDCFQDALLTLVKKVKDGSYDESFEVKNYLFVVARNIWFNKSKKSSKIVSKEVEEFTLSDDSLQGEELIIEDERRSAIHELMSKAGERCRELLRLVLFENKSLSEIVPIMGFSSVGVVKTNHYRCKQKLKEALKADPLLLSTLKAG